jgi:hypothetical protein
VSNLSALTLADLVITILHEYCGLSNGLLIEFNNDILYEECEDLDEDEAEIYERRLKKSLQDLKIRDLSIL